MLRVLVMVSGGGTNLQAILDSVQSGEITDTEIVGVISNNPGAYALERCEKAGVPVECISPKSYASRAEFNQEFLKAIDSYEPDLIVLAGFLVVIPPEMIQKYRNRIINIHPSLIPSFCGTGFYGLKVHEAALARGVKAVEVQNGDTPEVLQRRVMEQAEWKILPRAIDLIAHGKVSVTDGKAIVSED